MKIPTRSIVLLIILIICINIFLYNKITSDESIINSFHKLYHTKYKVHQYTYWFGIKTLQTPLDMWNLQEIIYETKPDIIIETGTYLGGTSLFLAMILQNVNENGKIITIDILDQAEKASQNKIYQDRVISLIGNSVSNEIIEQVKILVKDAKTMVILDSAHEKNHVLTELKKYSQFVSPGCYIIIHDTNFNGNPVKKNFGPGPKEAVMEFLKSTDEFIIDKKKEKFLLTYSPQGYLKRIKN
ncbi:MAG: CmcI family methyltransferase [Promethearchaeota archaeon]